MRCEKLKRFHNSFAKANVPRSLKIPLFSRSWYTKNVFHFQSLAKNKYCPKFLRACIALRFSVILPRHEFQSALPDTRQRLSENKVVINELYTIVKGVTCQPLSRRRCWLVTQHWMTSLPQPIYPSFVFQRLRIYWSWGEEVRSVDFHIEPFVWSW